MFNDPKYLHALASFLPRAAALSISHASWSAPPLPRPCPGPWSFLAPCPHLPPTSPLECILLLLTIRGTFNWLNWSRIAALLIAAKWNEALRKNVFVCNKAWKLHSSGKGNQIKNSQVRINHWRCVCLCVLEIWYLYLIWNCSQCKELLHGHMETAKRMEDTDVLSMLLLLLPRLVRLRLFLLLLDHTLLPSVSFFPSGRLPRSSCNNYSIWFTPPHPISLAPFVILRRVPFLLGLAHCCYHTWIAAKCVARWRRHSLHLFSPVYLSLCHLSLKRKSLLLQRKWI